jgi:hypothetical protein
MRKTAMKKSFLRLGAIVIALMIGAILASAQGISPPPTAFEQPPKVGDMAPDFALPSGGKLAHMKLSDLRGKKKVLLAFYVFDFTGG